MVPTEEARAVLPLWGPHVGEASPGLASGTTCSIHLAWPQAPAWVRRDEMGWVGTGWDGLGRDEM